MLGPDEVLSASILRMEVITKFDEGTMAADDPGN